MIGPLQHAIMAKKTGSALTPLLWAVGVSGTFTSSLYITVGGWPAHVALSATIALIVYLLRVFEYLLKRAPNRLHSEGHIQQMASIALMGDSNSGQITINSDPVTNPHLGVTDER